MTSPGTSTVSYALRQQTGSLVLFASDGDVCLLWFDGTNQVFSYANSSAGSSWTKTTIIGGTHMLLGGHMRANDTIDVVTGGAAVNTPQYYPLTRSQSNWILGTANIIDSTAAGSAGLGNVANYAGQDAQGRHWVILGATSTYTSRRILYSPANTPTNTAWTVAQSGAQTGNINSPAGDQVGNYIVEIWWNGTAFQWDRIDNSGTIGSFSANATITGLTGSPDTNSYIRFKAISPTLGLLVYSTTASGVYAQIYNSATDTWGTATQLSSGIHDVQPTIATDMNGNAWVAWCSWAAANSYALVYKSYQGGVWSAAATTLVASGTNVQWPNAAWSPANGAIGIAYMTGTVTPWTINWTSFGSITTKSAAGRMKVQLGSTAGNTTKPSTGRMKFGLSAYVASVISDGATGYWDLADPGPILLDHSGNNAHGFARGGVAYQQVSALPRQTWSKSILFDGDTGYATLPFSANLGGTAHISVECWVRPQNIIQENNPRIISCENGNNGWFFYMAGNGGSFNFNVGNGTTTATASFTTSSLNAGHWYHLVGTYDGANVRIYVNGAVGTTAPALTTAVGMSAFAPIIAKNPNSTVDWFDGNVQDVSVYKTALSGANILTHLLNGNGLKDWDEFNRAAIANPPNAVAWTTTGGANTLAVSSSQATITTTVNSDVFAVIGAAGSTAPNFTDISVTVTKFESLSSGVAGIYLRYSATNTYYRLELNGANGLLRIAKDVAGVAAFIDITSYTVPGFAFGTGFHLRATIVGTRIYGKVWAIGAVEPDGYQVFGQSDASLTSGNVGMYHNAQTASSEVTTYDDYGIWDATLYAPVTTTSNATGRLRFTSQKTDNFLGRTRLASQITKNATGRERFAVLAAIKNFKGRMTFFPQKTRSAVGRERLGVQVNPDFMGRLRNLGLTTKNGTGRERFVVLAAIKNATGRLRNLGLTTKNATGRERFAVLAAIKNATGRTRFGVQVTKNGAGRVRVSTVATATRNAAGRERFVVLAAIKNAVGRERFVVQVTKNASGRERFTTQSTKNGVGRTRFAVLAAIKNGKGRIRLAVQITRSASGRERFAVLAAIKNGKGRIVFFPQVIRSATGRERFASLKTSNAVGRLRNLGLTLKNAIGRARVVNINLIQKNSVNSAASTTSQAITLGAGVTLGNLLIVTVAVGSNTTSITPPDVSWTQATINQPAGASATIETAIYYLLVDAGHAGATSWTWTFGASHTVYICMEEWFSVKGWPANPLDVTANGDTIVTPVTATTIVSGTTATTAQAEELWIGVLAYKGSAQAESSITSGWIKDAEATLAANNTSTLLSQVVESTGAAAVQYNIGTTEFWAGSIATFKPNTNPSTTRSAVGRTRFVTTSTKNATGRQRFAILAAIKNSTGRVRFYPQTTKSGTGRQRFVTLVIKNGKGRATLALKTLQNATGRTRFTPQTIKSGTGRTRILRSGYDASIIADTPIRYYTLDEPAGTNALDFGSQRKDGTFTGVGITYASTTIVPNSGGKSATFNGTSGDISLPTTGLPTGASAISLEAWVKVPVLQAALQCILGAGTYPAGGSNLVELYIHTDNKFYFGFNTASVDCNANVVTVANGVYHLVGTQDGTTQKLYVNGVLQTQTRTTTINIAYGFAMIGNDGSGTDWFKGIIQKAAIYNYALTATQAMAHYQAGLNKRTGNITGRLALGGTVRNYVGRERFVTQVTKNAAGRQRFAVLAAIKNTTGRVRFYPQTTKSAVGRERFAIQTIKSATGRTRFAVLAAIKNGTGRIKLATGSLRSAAGRERLVVLAAIKNGKGRAVVSTLHTLNGKGRARFAIQVIRNAVGRARYSALTAKSSAARLRVSSAVTRNYTGRVSFAIRAAIKNATGRTRIIAQHIWNYTGRLRLSSTVSTNDNNYVGRVRIVAVRIKSTAGRMGSVVRVLDNATGRLRYFGKTLKGASGRTNVAIRTLSSSAGRIRFANLRTKNATGRARLFGYTTKSAAGRLLVDYWTYKHFSARMRFAVQSVKNTTGRLRVGGTTLKNASGRARIVRNTIKNAVGRFNIFSSTHAWDATGRLKFAAGITTRNSTGRTRFTAMTTRNASGRSRVVIQTQRNPAGRLRFTHVADIDSFVGRVRLANTHSANIAGRTRFTGLTATNATGRAKFIGYVLRTSTGRTRLAVKTTRTSTARLALGNVRTIGFTARERVVRQSTRSGVGRVLVFVKVAKNSSGRLRLTFGVVLKNSTGRLRLFHASIYSSHGRIRLVAQGSKTATGRLKYRNGTTRSSTGRLQFIIGTTDVVWLLANTGVVWDIAGQQVTLEVGYNTQEWDMAENTTTVILPNSATTWEIE